MVFLLESDYAASLSLESGVRPLARQMSGKVDAVPHYVRGRR